MQLQDNAISSRMTYETDSILAILEQRELVSGTLAELEAESFAGTLMELQAEYYAEVQEREEENRKDQERCAALLMQALYEKSDRKKRKRNPDKEKVKRAINLENIRKAMDFSGPFYAACLQLGLEEEMSVLAYLQENKNCELMKKFSTLVKSGEFLESTANP